MRDIYDRLSDGFYAIALACALWAICIWVDKGKDPDIHD